MSPSFTRLLLILLTTISGLSAQESQRGVVDLLNLKNYANQEVPAYITRDNTPADNPITDLGATLGRVLFYDKRLSRNDTISCASCHQQANAFGDSSVASTGVSGTTPRHSMRLVNIRFSSEQTFFWDERAPSLEDLATQPLRDHVEMGFSGENGDPALSELVTKLENIEEYRVLFRAVYGDAAVTEARIQKPLAQFMRSIQSFDSRFDVGRSMTGNNSADFPNFTAAENAGKEVFIHRDKASCATCHVLPEAQITFDSGNNGIIGTIDGGVDTTVTRAPALRDLVGPEGQSNGPFMHTGELATIEEVIEHYNLITNPHPDIEPRLNRDLDLTDTQKANLAAFLRTLSGRAIYTDVRWSDPFDEEGQLSLVVLPSGGVKVEYTGEGDGRIAAVSTTAVPRVNYICQWSTDMKNWNSIPVTADDQGLVMAEISGVSDLDRCFFRFAYQVE